MGCALEDVMGPVLMQCDRQHHSRQTFDMRGNLVHADAQPVHAREARLEAFLAKNPGWQARQRDQTIRDITARYALLSARSREP